MIVACPSCKKKIKAPDSAGGKKVKCPSCGAVMVLPMPVQDAEVINPQTPPPATDPFSAPVGGGLSSLLDEADEMYSVQNKPAQPSADPFGGQGSSAVADSGVPRRPCPACGEMIVMSALKCRFCGETFDPGLKRKSKRGGGDDDDLTGVEWVVAILCSGIGCICGVIWVIQGKPKGGKMLAVSIIAGVFWNIVSAVLKAMIEAGQ